MRYAALLALCAAACAADPVLLPDAGPCAGSCGSGTVCVGGSCVAIDAGAPDAPPLDAGTDAGDAPDAPTVDAPTVDALADGTAPDAAETSPTDAPAAVDAPDARSVMDASEAGADVPRDTASLPDGSHFWDVQCESCSQLHAECICTAEGAVYTCHAGYVDCDGRTSNGCEAHLFDDAANCGACGVACAPRQVCAGRCLTP